MSNDREDRKQYTLRINEVILEKLKIIAKKELRNANAQFEYFIIAMLKDYSKENNVIKLRMSKKSF